MHPNAVLLERFYTCFRQLDGQGMAACYHEDIRFSDPVFPDLQGAAAGAMWQMLCAGAKGFELSFSDIHADDARGSASWEARYDFSATGRRVRNRVTSTFQFKDGLIFRQQDSFSFWKWSVMALGTPGVLLGWTPLLRNKVRKQARKGLNRFMASTGGQQPEPRPSGVALRATPDKSSG